MKGLIVYDSVRIEKNRDFARLLTEKLSEEKIESKLIVCDKASDLLSLPKYDFAIMRSDNYLFSDTLEKLGVTCFNCSFTQKICNDKFLTYNLLNGFVPMMPTYEIANGEKPKLNFPFVLKTKNGHGGTGVFLINDEKQLKDAFSVIGNANAIVQPFCDTPGVDIRVYILFGKPMLAIKRSSKTSFKSNFSLGGKAERIEIPSSAKDICGIVIEKLKLDYAGIDFIFDKSKPILNEIEDVVGARMVYNSCDFDIVKEYIKQIPFNIKKA